MRGLSLKFLILTVLGITAALFLCCLEPVNKGAFFEDDTVKEIIERNRPRVGLIDYTGDDLQAGDKVITGLNPDKFYMVEIRDEDGEPYPVPKIVYVMKDGNLAADMKEIGKVTGRTIRNLDNPLTYAVYSASPLTLTDPITLYIDFSAITPISLPLETDDNGLTLSSKYAEHFLDLSSVIETGTKIVNANDNKTEFIRIELAAAGTTTYFVFHDISDPESFRFLRVIIEPIPTFTINITSTDVPSAANAPGITHNAPTSGTFNQGAEPIVTFTAALPVSGTGSYTAYQWWFGGELQTSVVINTLIIDFSNIDYKRAGVYEVHVVATHNTDGPLNSARIIITVTEGGS